VLDTLPPRAAHARSLDASAARPTVAAARAGAYAALGSGVFDLLVVGGGITGAGVARDAAARGLRVALVERDDFAAGTSSRSSRLVHGGVRYLEHGHLGLVFEASRERRTLLATAPHLVRPLAFTWPVYRGARVPRWKLAAGLALYDALALWRNVGAHRALGAAGVLAREPALRADALVGGAAYWDAATDDSRLTLATALDAEALGAVLLTHAEVAGLAFAADGEGARVRAAVRDRLDGPDDPAACGDPSGDRAGGPCVEVRARVVVNCAGPWADRVRALAEPGAPMAVLGAKGVHVLVPAARVGNRGALTLAAPRDGRVMFVLPAGGTAAAQFTLVGTTETPAVHGPDAVRATAADVDYLLEAVNHHFPDAALTDDDVVSAWAGVRPLAALRGAGTAGGGTGAASREHAVEVDGRGLVTVSGGKLTTYRAMAAQVVDVAATALLGARPAPANTAHRPLPGGEVADLDAEAARAAAAAGDAAAGRRLAHAHGVRWPEVWALADAVPALGAPLVPGLPYVGAEFVHAVRREHARTLADLLVRRTPVAFETRDAGRAAARGAAALVAGELGWDAGEVARQLAAYDREAARLFAIDP
jgi:glycerol-3-phosphate dehydrogenase